MRPISFISKKISAFLRGTIHILRTLVGIRPKEGGLDYSATATAVWIFVIGIPIGMLFFGSEAFLVSVWALVVLIALVLMNLDDAIQLISNFFSYGVDGIIIDKTVEMYEEPANG